MPFIMQMKASTMCSLHTDLCATARLQLRVNRLPWLLHPAAQQGSQNAAGP